VVAEHRESLSRGSDLKPDHQVRFFHENKVMEERWGSALTNDRSDSRYSSRAGGLFAALLETEKFATAPYVFEG
jgi:hypothetical protein